MLIDVLLPGAAAVTQMDDSELLKLEGGYENDNEIARWVQYHLITTGDLVHRSADVTLKEVPVASAFANL